MFSAVSQKPSHLSYCSNPSHVVVALYLPQISLKEHNIVFTEYTSRNLQSEKDHFDMGFAKIFQNICELEVENIFVTSDILGEWVTSHFAIFFSKVYFDGWREFTVRYT